MKLFSQPILLIVLPLFWSGLILISSSFIKNIGKWFALESIILNFFISYKLYLITDTSPLKTYIAFLKFPEGMQISISNLTAFILIFINAVMLFIYICSIFRGYGSDYFAVVFMMFLSFVTGVMISSGMFLTVFSILGVITALSVLKNWSKISDSHIEDSFNYFSVSFTLFAVMLFGILLLYFKAGNLNYDYISGLIEYNNESIYSVIFIMILTGIFQFFDLLPFSGWLMKIYEKLPSILVGMISGCIHLSCGLLLIKLIKIFLPPSFVLELLSILGLLTMIFSVFAMLKERNVKKIFLFSNIFYTGMFWVLISKYTPETINAALYILIIHSVIKSALFVSLDYLRNIFQSEDISKWSRVSPNLQIFFFVFNIFMLAGIPFSAGFSGKLYAVKYFFTESSFIYISLFFILWVLEFYVFFRIIYRILFYKNKINISKRERNSIELIYVMTAAVFGALIGIFPGLFYSSLLNSVSRFFFI